MNNSLRTLLAVSSVPPVTFPTDSRYYGSATLSYSSPSGQTITYLERRLVPQPTAANYATVAKHTVTQGERLDLITAKYLGDPLLFWLVCDANGAFRPDDLVETPGTVLNITMPQGIPGGSGA